MTSEWTERLVVLASSLAALLVAARLLVVHPITLPLLCRAASGHQRALQHTAGVRPLHLPLRLGGTAMCVM